ncbi:hypothetical protein BJY01DRAFT_123326 [Aspergillus pseudoustus]|uniref:Uncharacterized protein n=1 Tax=Aspergillus pseudoustus TaxID=1810923 RepID=A0ABR4IS76_9EURO
MKITPDSCGLLQNEMTNQNMKQKKVGKHQQEALCGDPYHSIPKWKPNSPPTSCIRSRPNIPRAKSKQAERANNGTKKDASECKRVTGPEDRGLKPLVGKVVVELVCSANACERLWRHCVDGLVFRNS